MVRMLVPLVGRCVGWVVVVFKQKTAYEMRISDWSSDVCSSDLTQMEAPVEVTGRHRPRGAVDVPGRGHVSQATVDVIGGHRGSAYGSSDRRSGVSGKSVSVRVDLGGRRRISTKKTHTNNTNKS